MKIGRRACSASATVLSWGRLLFCLAAISGTFAVSARADSIVLPPVTLAHCAVNFSVLYDRTTCSLGASDTAFASLTLDPFVSLSVHASSPGALGIHGSGASATVTYSFQVNGGTVGDIVPILIATTLNTTSSGPTDLAIGFASLGVQTTAIGSATLKAVCTDGTCGTSATSFSGTVSTRAKSGAVGDTLTLNVATSIGGTQQAESASASADPFIFIDPSFANASLYTIVVSPGVGNAPVSSVPEPSSGMLVTLGALVLAAMLKQKKKQKNRDAHSVPFFELDRKHRLID